MAVCQRVDDVFHIESPVQIPLVDQLSRLKPLPRLPQVRSGEIWSRESWDRPNQRILGDQQKSSGRYPVTLW